MKRILIASLLLLPLAGCNWWNAPTPPTDDEQSSSVPETKNVIYRGMLWQLGASIYMEGTHRLELEDGRFVLLESNGLLLDDYLGENVEVFGATRPTVEGGGIIMRVERIADIEKSSLPEEEEQPSSSSSSSAEAVAASVPAASSMPAVPASAAPATSRAPVMVIASSKAPIAAQPASSAAPVAVASSASSDPLAAKTATMAKANLAPVNWTQEYCSPPTLGFCFPIHKNWYFASFGATSSSLWHVEVGPSSVEILGDGPFVVVLVSGAASVPDGTVTIEGETAVVIRAWSGGKHFEIRAPKALEQVVRYVTQELKAAPVAEQ